MAPIQNTITVRIALPYCNNNILFLTGTNQAMIGPLGDNTFLYPHSI